MSGKRKRALAFLPPSPRQPSLSSHPPHPQTHVFFRVREDGEAAAGVGAGSTDSGHPPPSSILSYGRRGVEERMGIGVNCVGSMVSKSAADRSSAT